MAKAFPRRRDFSCSDVASIMGEIMPGGPGLPAGGGAGLFVAPAAMSVRSILNIPDMPFEAGPRPRTCQWVTSDGAPWTFCDAPVAHAGSSFCAPHHARAWYVPPKASGDRPLG
jgi:hypothetical protein